MYEPENKSDLHIPNININFSHNDIDLEEKKTTIKSKLECILIENLKRGEKLNVLVVDDNIFNIEAFQSLLEDYTKYINCDTCLSGLDALNKISEDKMDFEIIFLDIDMPKLNGIETCNRIKTIY